MITFEIY